MAHFMSVFGQKNGINLKMMNRVNYSVDNSSGIVLHHRGMNKPVVVWVKIIWIDICFLFFFNRKISWRRLSPQFIDTPFVFLRRESVPRKRIYILCVYERETGVIYNKYDEHWKESFNLLTLEPKTTTTTKSKQNKKRLSVSRLE